MRIYALPTITYNALQLRAIAYTTLQ